MNKFLFNFLYNLALRFYKPEPNFFFDTFQKETPDGIPVVTHFGSCVSFVRGQTNLNNVFFFDKKRRIGVFLPQKAECVELIIQTPKQILEMNPKIPFDYTNCSEHIRTDLENYRKILLEQHSRLLTDKEFFDNLEEKLERIEEV